MANTRVMALEAYAREAPWAPDMIEAWGRLETLPYHPNQVAMNRVIRDAMQEALRNPNADVTEMAARYQSQLNRLARLGR